MIQVVVPEWVDREHGAKTLKAFAEGCGGEVVDPGEAKPGRGPMVFWGIHKRRFPFRSVIADLQRAQRESGELLVILERGYVQREDYYAACIDGLNGRSRDMGEVPADRWERLGVELKPWRPHRGRATVVGQVPWDTSCQHVDHQAWVSRAISDHSRAGYIVTFRPHPLQPGMIEVPPGVPVDRRPVEEFLADDGLVVTFSSTTGVHSVIAGRPTVGMDPTSMVYGKWPGRFREPWAHSLAYQQWTLEEMASGEAWAWLQRFA